MPASRQHHSSPRQGSALPSLLLAGSLWLVARCSDDPYERAVESPESEHDPTSGPVDPPPAQTAPPREDTSEPMDLDDAAVLDPTEAPAVDPVGERVVVDDDADGGDASRSD